MFLLLCYGEIKMCIRLFFSHLIFSHSNDATLKQIIQTHKNPHKNHTKQMASSPLSVHIARGNAKCMNTRAWYSVLGPPTDYRHLRLFAAANWSKISSNWALWSIPAKSGNEEVEIFGKQRTNIVTVTKLILVWKIMPAATGAPLARGAPCHGIIGI